MRQRLSDLGRSVLRLARRVASFGSRQLVAFGELWRRSLQFRVTVSTLALSSVVVLVLGMVLQNQITERLVDSKERAAIAQLQVVVRTAENELVGDAGQDEALRNRLANALKKITTSSVATQDIESSAAGAFEPVLAAGDPDGSSAHAVTAGPHRKVPEGLRSFVEHNEQGKQVHTVDGATYLMVGAPVTTTSRPLQLYLLFPLATEQNTVTTVQNTLLVGSLVLVLLLASITNMVTRQVVRPVRRAAAAAERFAEGELDRRLDVDGEDDLDKLAVSYNEMAASIQRQIRQLEEFGQLQRRFTSDVAHELRTPLTTVRMAADVLHASREQFPAGLARSTELLTDELDRFETLLGDLLEISRLDAGVEELSAELIDVRSIVHRAVEQVSVIAGSAGSVIELDLPEHDVEAEVDSRRVERILRNLLANAVDHGEARPVRLTLAATDDTLAVTVRDYGVGLRPGEGELVFNRFWRADPSRNRRTGGTGLGLAISQEDARLHGGSLSAWGLPGEGSCFRMTLPRRVGVVMGKNPLPLPDEPKTQPIPAVPAADREAQEQAADDAQAPGDGRAAAGGTASSSAPEHEEVR